MHSILIRLVTLGVLLGLLGGCSDALYLMDRTVLGVDCRPEKLEAGQCAPTR